MKFGKGLTLLNPEHFQGHFPDEPFCHSTGEIGKVGLRHLVIEGFVSNNSPPPLIVTMTSLSGLSPRSKRMSISQMYIKLWHELLRATLLALTLYNIYIYRHESP